MINILNFFTLPKIRGGARRVRPPLDPLLFNQFIAEDTLNEYYAATCLMSIGYLFNNLKAWQSYLWWHHPEIISEINIHVN